MALPLWATPERLEYLVKLFESCSGFCVYGHKPCPIPEHHFEFHIEQIIEYWKQDDRETRADLKRVEDRVLHYTPDQHGWGQRFDPVARELFFNTQPPFYLEGLGISGLTFKAIAKVRVPSTMHYLFVDVPRRKMSKNQRRKARRYHHQSVHTNCQSAVKHFMKNK